MNKKNSPEQVISNIRKEYGIQQGGTQKKEVGRLSRNLKSAIEQLSVGLYGEDVHFILELIQNAEDNHYTTQSPDLRFVVLDDDPTNTPDSDGCLCIFNNESGFEEINIDRICQIGQSSKTKKDGYIGEKGIGFKSVFIASAEPHIYSNGYQIKFKENDTQLDLAYIVPYWLNSIPDIVKSDSANTKILLPIKQGKKQEIINGLKKINPETVLFLSKLEGLSIEFRGLDTSISLIRDNSNLPFVDLLIEKNNKDSEISRYVTHSETVGVPTEIREEKREGIADRTITVAFPLANCDSNGRIYAFLPTEVDSGLPFLVNTDFILTANRESIQSNKAWNIWLRDELAEVIVKGLEALVKDEDNRNKTYGFIPLVKEIEALKDYFSPVCTSVQKSLSDKCIVINELGDLVKPEQSRRARKEIRDLFSDKDKPFAFEKFCFVDSRIEKFALKLEAIGVNVFSYEDLKLCLSDSNWLQKKDSNWFFHLYDVLKKNSALNHFDLTALTIIPVQDGNKITSGEFQIFFPSDEKLSVKINEGVKSGSLPDVYFLDNRLYNRLSNNSELFIWVKESLDIVEFSISSYICNALVPWLNSEVKSITEKQLLGALTLIIEHWSDLNDEEKRGVGSDLPVILDTGEIFLKKSLDGNELLVPRKLDNENGWQNFLIAKEDYQHVDVLSDRYIQNYSSKIDVLNEYFTKMGAEKFPDLVEVQIKLVDQHKSKFSEYAINVFSNFNEEYTHDDYSRPKITSWGVPLFLFDKAKRENKKICKAFVYWLEKMVEERHDAMGKGVINWFRYSSKSQVTQSAFDFYLKSSAWLKTTKGFRPPGEIFVKNNHIFEIFGNKLAYLEGELSPELCDFLGIKSEVTTETVIDYLKELSNQEAVDFKLINQLYKYLDEYGEDFRDSFKENKLIYIPDSKLSWHASDEVIWDDNSDVLDNLYGWLSPRYNLSLRGFFVGTLGVSDTVKDWDLARAWLQLPDRERLDASQIEVALARIYSRLLATSRSNEDRPEWWSEIIDTVLIWSQKDSFLDRDNLYIADDNYLSNLFRNDLEFAWKPNELTYNEMADFYRELEIRYLSESIDSSLHNTGEQKVIDCPIYLTDYSKQLLCYFIYNDSSEKYYSLLESGTLRSLLLTSEAETEELNIQFRVDGLGETKIVDDEIAFWDDHKSFLFCKRNSDSEDLLDSVAEVIARSLWGRNYKKYEDNVKALLRFSTEERFKKFKDKKGWHLPPKIKKGITALIESDDIVSFLDSSDNSEDIIDPPTKDGSVENVANNINSDSDSDDESDHSQNTDLPFNSESHEPSEDHPSQENTDLNSEKPFEENNSSNEEYENTNSRSGTDSRNTATGHRQSSVDKGYSGNRNNWNVRGGKSRSSGIANSINQARRNRMHSYVHSELTEDIDSKTAEEQQNFRKELGDKGELIVLRDLQSKGWKARRMPENNPGYDIEAQNTETGELFFVEVKGESFTWCDKGVGISSKQYRKAEKEGETFILAIVENLRQGSPLITYIKDPLSYITEYRFDDGWRELSTNIQTIKTFTQNISDMERLSRLTDSEECRLIIEFCDSNHFPLPDVGLELVDDSGRVLGFELELAWEEEKMGVLLSESSEASVDNQIDDWMLYSEKNIVDIKERLAKTFSTNTGCDD